MHTETELQKATYLDRSPLGYLLFECFIVMGCNFFKALERHIPMFIKFPFQPSRAQRSTRILYFLVVCWVSYVARLHKTVTSVEFVKSWPPCSQTSLERSLPKTCCKRTSILPRMVGHHNQKKVLRTETILLPRGLDEYFLQALASSRRPSLQTA